MIKINIKNKIKEFDEKLVFEDEEELNYKIDLFLSQIDKNYLKKYLILYISEKLKQRLKLERKLELSKKSKNTLKRLKIKEELQNINVVVKVLDIKLEKLSEKEIKEETNIVCEEKKEEVFEINKKTNDILTKLESKNINILDYKENFEDFFKTYLIYLKTHIPSFEYISDFIELLYILEKENKMSKEDIELYLYAVIDVIDNKITKIPKNNELRDKLKRVKNKLGVILEFYKTDTSKKKHDYYYDILEVLLENPRNYYIIEKLLNDMSDFVNASKRIRVKKGYNNKEIETYYMEHILVTIVDKYIENYKLELRGQTKDYVDKNYYLKLYYLFIKNPYLEIDKKVIYKMLNEFLQILDKSNYLRKNKEKITKEIDAMIREEEIKEKTEVKSNTLNHINYLDSKIENAKFGDRVRMDREYFDNLSSLYQRIISEIDNPNKEKLKNVQRTLKMSNRDRRNVLLGCDTITCANNHSYTISYYDDGSYSFRFNVIDLYDTIKDSPIEDYLLDNLTKQDRNILEGNDKLNFKEGKVVPTITYEVRVYLNGYVGPLKIYKSVTEVEKKYNSIATYKEDQKLKNLITIYKVLSSNNKPNLDLEIADNYFKEFFFKLIKEYALKYNIPLIVKGKNHIDEDYYLKLHYDLCEIYSKLDRKSFERIYNILKMNLDQKHYENSNYDNGDYSPSLDNDYIKYFNQKMLSDFILKREVDESYISESNEIVDKANSGIFYIRDKSIDKNKSKVYYN